MLLKRKLVVRPCILLGAGLCLFAGSICAQQDTTAAEPDQPTLMNQLAARGLHDVKNERWNAYGQFTYISSWHPGFQAPYTNFNGSTNSLLPNAERSFTGTATLYVGVRLWKGAEGYLVPELISEKPFSELKGLGGAIQNFELQKGGAELPQVYRSRAFLKQTISLGGDEVTKDSGPMQLGSMTSSRRLVLIAGNFSILDFFDKPAFEVDPRQGFLNLGFLTSAAYDFASDARGYSWGGVAELYWDNWAVRFGRITPPKNPNQLPIDFRLGKYYGDQAELEHRHSLRGKAGVIRLLAYRNRENIGRFSDAVAAFLADPQKNANTCPGFSYDSGNAGAPDLCWARKTGVKTGFGVFAQQYLTRDIGVFARGMVSDGESEVYAYTATDRSASFGAMAHGSRWGRSGDLAGAGMNLGWISASHAKYLRMGGVDGFIGDGKLRQGMESAVDVFYSVNLHRGLWLSGDYQYVVNPAFNADRGPVHVLGLRIHGEF